MRITSDRWHMISLPLIVAIVVYVAVGHFDRHSTGGLVMGSITLWNAAWAVGLYVWWWPPKRRALQAALKKTGGREGIALISSMLAGVAASLSLMFGGIGLLEQDSLEFQGLGILLLVMAALVIPVWSLWHYRWLIRRRSVASV